MPLGTEEKVTVVDVAVVPVALVKLNAIAAELSHAVVGALSVSVVPDSAATVVDGKPVALMVSPM